MILFHFICVLNLFVCAKLAYVRASASIWTIQVNPSTLISRCYDHWTPLSNSLSLELPKRALCLRSSPKKLFRVSSSLNHHPSDIRSFDLWLNGSLKKLFGITCPLFTIDYQHSLSELRANQIGLEIDVNHKLSITIEDDLFERDEALNALLSLCTQGFQSSIRMIKFIWRGSKLDESWLNALTSCEIQHVVLELSPNTPFIPFTNVAHNFFVHSRPHTIRLSSSISQTLWADFVRTFPTSMPSIKIIEVVNATMSSFDSLAPLLRCANNLEILKIDARLKRVYFFQDFFALNLPKLHTLSLSYTVPRATWFITKNWIDVAMIEFMCRIPELKHLTLNPMLTFDPKTITSMSEQMKSLETFEVFLDNASAFEVDGSAISTNPSHFLRHFPHGNGREVLKYFFNGIQRTLESPPRNPIKYIIHYLGETNTYVPTSFPTETNNLK